MIERDLVRIKNINDIHSHMHRLQRFFTKIGCDLFSTSVYGNEKSNSLWRDGTSDSSIYNSILKLGDLLESYALEIEDMRYKIYIEFIINYGSTMSIYYTMYGISYWMIFKRGLFEEFIESAIKEFDKAGIYYDKLKEIHLYASGDMNMYRKLCEKEFGKI